MAQVNVKKWKKSVNVENAKDVYRQSINDIAEKVVLLMKGYDDDIATEMLYSV